MTELEIFERFRALACEVLGVRDAEVGMGSNLVNDLGAESIDLLDLVFLVEEKFGVPIEPNEFEKEVRRRIPDGEYERDGILTDTALDELRRLMPEVDPARFVRGLRRAEIPSLLTVGVFVHIIGRKLEAAGLETRHES